MLSAKIDVINNDLVAAFRQIVEQVLAMETIDAVLVPKRPSPSAMVMPSLITDPKQLEGMDPLAPAFAYNAATVVSRLTRRPSGHRIAVMLRPCEIRAFIELVKLNQGSLEEIVTIGSDCLGAMGNVDYLLFADPDGPASTRSFYQNLLQNQDPPMQGIKLAAACQACEHPFADGADLAVGLWGVNTRKHLLLLAQSDKGDQLLTALKFPQTDIPPGGPKKRPE